jgi:hypothetical protein
MPDRAVPMTDLATGRGCLAAILIFFAALYGLVAIRMCLNEGCPAYDVDLGGAVDDR